jgi:glycosyltransferase involved in cell wall biosynthesis
MKIVFMMIAKLNTGRGTERVLLNLLKFKPNNVEAIILEPNFLDHDRLNDFEIKKFIGNSERIPVNVSSRKFDNVYSLLWDRLVKKTLYHDLRQNFPEDLKQRLNGVNIVYLFSNVFSIFFDGFNVPIIGSNHTDNLEFLSNSKNMFKQIYHKYMINNYYKYISGFHLFPKNEGYMHINNMSNLLKHNFILPIGIDTSVYYPDFSIDKNTLKCLFVASLSPEKGLNILLRLAEKFKSNRQIEFHVVGTGILEGKVRKNKKIIFHGLLNDVELSELYRKSDLFIYPTNNDIYPSVVLQALSSGLYVLTSHLLRGTFDDFEGKYLCYLENKVETYYRKLCEIIQNREIVKLDKSKLYNYVKSNYDWSIICKLFYDYMETFAGTK